MKVTLINKSDGSVRAHAAGCRDIKRESKHFLDTVLPAEEYDTKREVFLDYNQDFIDEADGDESNSYSIDFAPCCNSLPEGTA